MKAIIKIEFVDLGDVLHESTITMDVNEALATEVRAGRIPNIEMAILPASAVSYTGGVIDLDELYGSPVIDHQDGWNIRKQSTVNEGIFTEVKEGNDGQG